jgi:hypothetical protein
MYLMITSPCTQVKREAGVLSMYWCSTYTRLLVVMHAHVCTATEQYRTVNNFLPGKKENLWWNQGSKASNARHTLENTVSTDSCSPPVTSVYMLHKQGRPSWLPLSHILRSGNI